MNIEKEALASLTKNQRRFLSRRVCGWCEHRLDKPGCGSIYGPKCTTAERIERLHRCLATYKPRKTNVTKD